LFSIKGTEKKNAKNATIVRKEEKNPTKIIARFGETTSSKELCM
jgi:hypothetical protein